MDNPSIIYVLMNFSAFTKFGLSVEKPEHIEIIKYVKVQLEYTAVCIISVEPGKSNMVSCAIHSWDLFKLCCK